MQSEDLLKRIDFKEYFVGASLTGPAIIEDLDEVAYRKMPAISSSLLKEFRKSGKHFLHSMVEKKERTRSMLMGSAFHCLLLEPYKFNKIYKVMPEFGDQRVAKNKAAKKEFMDEFVGAEFLTPCENETLLSIADSYFLNELASDLLSDVKAEVSLFSTEASGLKIKGRVDAVGSEYFIDLKTTRCSEPNFFNREIRTRGYLQQMAFYKRLTEITMKGAKKKPIIIACENVAPFNVTVFEFNNVDFGKLSQEIARDLEMMAHSLKAYSFKTYSEASIEFDDFSYEKTFVGGIEEESF